MPPKKLPPKKTKPKQPEPVEKTNWWKTLPGIITGITAFIVAVTSLVTALSDIKFPEFGRGKGDCSTFGQTLLASSIRVGNSNSRVVEYVSEDSLSKARILDVTDDESRIIGRIQYRFDPGTRRFEIISVVDGTCAATSSEPYFVELGEEFDVKFDDDYMASFNLVSGEVTATVAMKE